jgi:hypothetical protein
MEESNDEARTGRCLCGAVRFTALRVRHNFGACHCRMCQRWAGGPFLAVTVPPEDISWDGGAAIATRQTSDWAERAWCAECGSSLWYRVTAATADTSGGITDAYEVPVGLFDDTSGFVMTSEIFIDRKPDAYAFGGDHPRMTEAEVLAKYGVKLD